MDLLENPFYILGATPLDDRYRIMELAEERSLLSDADACTEARTILTNPRRRIAAEVAWLPGVAPDRYDEVSSPLASRNQNLPNTAELTPLAGANLLVFKLSHLSSANRVYTEWILAIAQVSENIYSREVCAKLNKDRRVAGFPEITDLSAIDDEIRKQRDYYAKTITAVLENLSVSARIGVMTLLQRSTSNGRCPSLIDDLISIYERGSLGQQQNIIEAQAGQLRAMADAQTPYTTLAPIVDQLCETLREWGTLVQPVHLRNTRTGQRHDASLEIQRRLRELAANLSVEHRHFDFSRQILNTLRNVFAGIPEIAEQIDEASRALEEHISRTRSIERYERIQSQVEELKTAADAQEPDFTLTPLVNQLIQTVRAWQPATQLIELNQAVCYVVREVALHLWKEHQKFDFARQIIKVLIEVFSGINGMAEVNTRLSADLTTLENQRSVRRGIETFEKIKAQVEELKTAADAQEPYHILTVNQLIQTVRAWQPATQPIEANEAVCYVVRGGALHLWNAHQKLDFAIQITNMLVEVFVSSNSVGAEVARLLIEDKMTLDEIRRVRDTTQAPKDTGCLLQIVIFAVLGLIGALLQGC